MKNSGKVVSVKDSADYIMFVIPPDTSVDKNLYLIKGYYPSSGKIMFVTGSKSPSVIIYQGSYISFYPNGRRHTIELFDDGKNTGDIIEYFPNGREYSKKTIVNTVTEEKEFLLRDCRDTTGLLTAENGNGKWIEYDKEFKNIIEEGPVVDGIKEGDWTRMYKNNTISIASYKNGKIQLRSEVDRDGNRTCAKPDIVPEFPGGTTEFLKFLGTNIRYPSVAREKGTQGVLIVTFVIEKDGSQSGVHITRGIGDGCDEEAVRVIALMPKWKPGMLNGKPVSVAFSVPIKFDIYEKK